MRWDTKPDIRRAGRWVDAVRKDKPDRKIINFPAEFIPGGRMVSRFRYLLRSSDRINHDLDDEPRIRS